MQIKSIDLIPFVRNLNATLGSAARTYSSAANNSSYIFSSTLHGLNQTEIDNPEHCIDPEALEKLVEENAELLKEVDELIIDVPLETIRKKVNVPFVVFINEFPEEEIERHEAVIEEAKQKLNSALSLNKQDLIKIISCFISNPTQFRADITENFSRDELFQLSDMFRILADVLTNDEIVIKTNTRGYHSQKSPVSFVLNNIGDKIRELAYKPVPQPKPTQNSRHKPPIQVDIQYHEGKSNIV